MNIRFVLRDIREARILKGILEENGFNTEIYENIEDIYSDIEKTEIIFIDIQSIDENKIIGGNKINQDIEAKKEEIKSNEERKRTKEIWIVFIVPFWMRFNSEKARELARKIGFRSARYIKRPFTAQEIVEYCKKILQQKRNNSDNRNIKKKNQ